MNWPQSPELTAAYTQGNFTKKEGERWTKMLTERLSNLTDENAEMLLNNKSSMKSKRLSDWWEQYKK